jgi:hypothetical protein
VSAIGSSLVAGIAELRRWKLAAASAAVLVIAMLVPSIAFFMHLSAEAADTAAFDAILQNAQPHSSMIALDVSEQLDPVASVSVWLALAMLIVTVGHAFVTGGILERLLKRGSFRDGAVLYFGRNLAVVLIAAVVGFFLAAVWGNLSAALALAGGKLAPGSIPRRLISLFVLGSGLFLFLVWSMSLDLARVIGMRVERINSYRAYRSGLHFAFRQPLRSLTLTGFWLAVSFIAGAILFRLEWSIGADDASGVFALLATILVAMFVHALLRVGAWGSAVRFAEISLERWPVVIPLPKPPARAPSDEEAGPREAEGDLSSLPLVEMTAAEPVIGEEGEPIAESRSEGEDSLPLHDDEGRHPVSGDADAPLDVHLGRGTAVEEHGVLTTEAAGIGGADGDVGDLGDVEESRLGGDEEVDAAVGGQADAGPERRGGS